MTTAEVLERLNNVKRNGNRQYSASCPCFGHGNGHGDKKQSLCIKEADDGKTLLYCQAGCKLDDILSSIELTRQDINPNKHSQSSKYYDQSRIVAVYEYRNGTRKCRDANKNFIWEHQENGQWTKGRGNAPHILYCQGEEQQNGRDRYAEKSVSFHIK